MKMAALVNARPREIRSWVVVRASHCRPPIVDSLYRTYLTMLTVVTALAAWSPQAPLLDRRAMLGGAAAAVFPAALVANPLATNAAVTDIGKAGLSKEEFYAALAARKEKERIAALPINRIKSLRDSFASASSLADADNWSGLRDLIQETTGPNLRTLLKEGRYEVAAVIAPTNQLRKVTFEVDKFAYSQQDFPGADLFAGYCAEGVVPRGDGGCKLKPKVDKSSVIAQLKEASALYDQLIKAAEGA